MYAVFYLRLTNVSISFPDVLMVYYCILVNTDYECNLLHYYSCNKSFIAFSALLMVIPQKPSIKT